MTGYGQYCPISRTAEVLGDRWTIHIVRDLLTGSSRFNELIRGNPGLSRPLLSRRLDRLCRDGVVEQADDGSYHLTDAGLELRSIIFSLAEWGATWTFGDPDPDELDPDLLLWWIHRQLDADALPDGRFTVYVDLLDHRKRYWIVVEDEASLCLSEPGFDVDVTVRADRATLYTVYLNRRTLADAHRAGDVELIGGTSAVRGFHRAFQPSPVADVVASAGT
ncbi:MAG: helix-turn-helix domain-containing protein [Acidimicrobiales bacterium]|nr:helix-turn-helix domain-containing protein [Acidimicrobiales bacterium]